MKHIKLFENLLDWRGYGTIEILEQCFIDLYDEDLITFIKYDKNIILYVKLIEQEISKDGSIEHTENKFSNKILMLEKIVQGLEKLKTEIKDLFYKIKEDNRILK